MSDNKENVPPVQLASSAEKIDLINDKDARLISGKRPRKPATEKQLETLRRGRELRLERKRTQSNPSASSSEPKNEPDIHMDTKSDKPTKECDDDDEEEEEEEDDEEEDDDVEDDEEEEEELPPRYMYQTPRKVVQPYMFHLPKVQMKRQKNSYANRSLFG